MNINKTPPPPPPTLTNRFYRGTGMEGWHGGSDGTKVLVFEVDMPHCGTEGFSECDYNRPAVWALNGKVRLFSLVRYRPPATSRKKLLYFIVFVRCRVYARLFKL